MKVEIIDPKEQFKPVKMGITFETKNEMRALWHRLNIGNSCVEENTDKNMVDFPDGLNLWELFNKLDDYMDANNLKKD